MPAADILRSPREMLRPAPARRSWPRSSMTGSRRVAKALGMLVVALASSACTFTLPLMNIGRGLLASIVSAEDLPRRQLVQSVGVMSQLELAGTRDAAPLTTPLMLAAHRNDVAQVKRLVAEGADVEGQDMYGWTALRYAVRANSKDAVEALIEGGADVNRPSQSGRTPLMSAAGNAWDGVVAALLKAGADTRATDSSGQTALDIARRGVGCEKVLGLLSEARVLRR
eukprot:TRINITY_DN32234_c0_g1_i1.p1 TRINITY_DN32234_c0_g1~~TRINITY_DN32234_c0_g1_i1.p1  ORF type:complete len:227 (+),score=44.65 TRINITY_DN32234_c0_g1_i1:166-846(+)